MRVFVSDLHSTLGIELTRQLQDAEHEVLGSVSSKTQLATIKRKLQEHPASDTATALKDPVALVTDKISLTKLVQRADVVITSLVNDSKHTMELLKLFEKPREESENEEEVDSGAIKRFIALTSVLTWSKNPSHAKDGRGHREDDFKTRKPARKYADLKTAETQILSAARIDQLETYLVASGLVYGGAQSNLGLLFRNAWMYPDRDLIVPSLPGCAVPRGENLLPMISVYDLALFTARLATNAGAVSKNYIIATDLASQTTTLRDLCVGLSVLLSNSRICYSLTDEQVDDLLVNEDDDVVGPLQVHICFDVPNETAALTQLVPVEEYMHIETGLLSNLAFYVQDFIASMDLRPLKTVILGPPRVGKSWLSERLTKEYYLPLLTVDTVLDELFAGIKTIDQQSADENGEAVATPEESPSDEVDEEVKKLREELRDWQKTAEGTRKSTLDLMESLVIDLLRWKLCSATCRNQGYVLDGLPTTVAQATKLFEKIASADGTEGDGEGEEGGGDEVAAESTSNAGDDPSGEKEAILDKLRPNKQIQLPNRVIMLDAPQQLLEERAQALTEEVAIATENTQVAFEKRYTSFMAEMEPLATFFEQTAQSDGIEVLELHLTDETSYHNSEVFLDPVHTYMEQGGHGKPNNFHPTREELRQMEREFTQKKQEEESRERQRAVEEDEREAAAEQARLAADQARLEVIQREEAELLESRAKPLRTFLMDTVLPALTEGMLEIVKVQPDDPIDYLAEFLFQKGQEMEANAASTPPQS
ncbi:hypothetical protein Poli38472_004487 [Pythium oligandrum]|uniref:Adenylate kinase n=1 Tax=Pythium oligandrum TaxID=41045 RepID=A0A8K1CAI3_PYTOL|nr:hypothetical protein Poli38472_004487 [Pythium oligandrum]|eukprot:TMW59418.1 hypothetical protein Poli38472_004487 [Pythium oligandrum]